MLFQILLLLVNYSKSGNIISIGLGPNLKYDWVAIRETGIFANDNISLIKFNVDAVHSTFPFGGFYFDDILSIFVSEENIN